MKKKIRTVEEAGKMTLSETASSYDHLNPTLASMLSLLNFTRRFVKAEGMSVYDEKGERYLDFLGGYGSLNLGHNHPAVWDAVEKIKSSPLILQASLNPYTAALAEALSVVSPDDLSVSFFGNSGAEAVEGALKLARAASGRESLLACENSFHGKTFGALSVTGRAKYQQAFKPLLPGCETVPFGNAHELEERLASGRFAAFIVEPIQGEGGINVPPEGYLKAVRDACSKSGTLLILDEIQTGLGRTGKLFACEHEGVAPDIMTLAKSLGGGVAPIGAYLTTDEIWSKAYRGIDKCLLHTSTFGGNTLAAACALAALNVIIKENLSFKAAENGAYFIEKLKLLKEKHEMIKDVRGLGLLIGVEFVEPPGSLISKLAGSFANKLSQEYLASFAASELLNTYSIITAYTLNNPNVIRFEPPLIIEREEIDYAVSSLDEICSKFEGILGLSFAAGKKLVKKFFKGGSK